MTRPLRRVHLLTWVILSVLLPLLFIAAIGRREPVPADRAFHWEKTP